MSRLAEFTDFVKLQAEYQDRRAIINRADSKKREFHIANARKFRSLLEFIEGHQNTTPEPSHIQPVIDPSGALLPKELAGLPQELINELSGGGIDKQELLIIELIEAAGGALSLDRILIGFYKNTGEVIKRNILTAKLYRMAQNGRIFRIPKKKGIYTTDPSLGSDVSSEDEQ